jgi:hypothetical protein
VLFICLCSFLVDGILLGLLKREFHSFARVGSKKKIHKSLANHVITFNEQNRFSTENEAKARKELSKSRVVGMFLFEMRSFLRLYYHAFLR